MLAHVLLQVASREESAQNGTVISTYTVQLYDEGQCHAGQWAARRGVRAGLRILRMLKLPEGLKPPAHAENACVSLLGLPEQCHKWGGLKSIVSQCW